MLFSVQSLYDMLFLERVQYKGVVFVDQNQQKLTAMRLKKIADHIEDTREEYNGLLLQMKKLIGGIEDKQFQMMRKYKRNFRTLMNK